jgi:hypothetical protein
MSSGQAIDEMTALRNKITSLEIQMKMQRVKRDNQAAWEKRDRKAAIEIERRDRLLENERRDREAGKKDTEMQMKVMEMETKAAQNEMRVERKDLEQKMELMNMQAAHALENEKRDRVLENEKRGQAVEKKEMEQKMELMNMQAAHALENEKRDRMIENEKRDRDAALEKKEMRHQIEQLKLEARFGQMEQQQRHYSQPMVTGSPLQPLQLMANPSPTHQGEQEQWLLRQLHELKLQKTESSHLQPPLPVHAVPSVSQEGMAAPMAPISNLPAGPRNAVVTGMHNMSSTNTAFQSAQPGAKSPMVALPSEPQGSTGSSAPLPSAVRPQPSSRSKQTKSIAAQSGSHTPAIPSKAVQPQHQVSIGPAARGGSIPLPGDASNHFFLSHCQATGGDQTNAIYLVP